MYKAIKEKLAQIFSDIEKQDEQFKTVSDSEVKISEKAVGGKVEAIDAEGNLSPMPDGDYQLEDGTPFKVKDGVIVEWDGSTEAPAPAEEPMAEDQPQDTPAEAPKPEDDLKAQVQAQADAISQLQQAVADLQTAVQGFNSQVEKEQEMAAQFSKQLDDINKTLKVIAEIPAEPSKTDNRNTIKDSYSKRKSDLNKYFGL